MKKAISLMLVLVYLASICAASAEIDFTPQNGMTFDEKSASVYTNETWSRTEEPHHSSIKNHLHISGITRGNLYTEFLYSDSMLLADARTVSAELTKASVCLAAAGYEKSVVNQMLAQMNFRIVGNYRFTDRSVEDNDHVAYTIGHKRIAGTDAYCVVIRGTCGDEEWFSNMNLGEANNGNHEGFYKAAEEVLADLYREADRNSIVWVTGHSRGAAVANIVAGRLTADWGGKHIFGYTYACPNVSKNVVDYENIHNFNNTGDLVSAIPLSDSEWSNDSRPYGRYGITHTWDFADDIIAMGKNYNGAHDTAAYEQILKKIVPSEQDYYNASSYFCMMLIAYFMQNNGSTSISEFLFKYGSRWFNDFMSQNKNILQTMKSICQNDDSLDEALNHLEQVQRETRGYTEEQFANYLLSHQDIVDEIERLSGMVIKTKNDLISLSQTVAKKALPERKQEKTASARVIGLGDLSAGNTLKAIQDAHSISSYLLAINHE